MERSHEFGERSGENPGPVGRIDGRTARRDRNREAVLDAVIELIAEENLDPAVHEVAERSGVSLRSVYRYFEDLDELIAAAIDRHLSRLQPRFGLDAQAQTPLDERIERFARHRVGLYEDLSAVYRAAAVRAATDQRVRDTIQESRRRLARHAREMFAGELTEVPEERAHYVTVSLDLVGQLDTIENLRTICGLDIDQTVDYLRISCRRLLRT